MTVPVIPNYDDNVLATTPDAGMMGGRIAASGIQGARDAATFSKSWYDFFNGVRNSLLAQNALDVTKFGARLNGDDDTFALQAAINAAVAQGGGIITVPNGTLSINSAFTPVGIAPIAIVGQGASTIIKRRGNLNAGQGLIDVSGSNFSIADLVIDGATITPRGLQYGVDFNGVGGSDPMADSLTRNTSVWVHGNTSMHNFNRVQFQHAGGYSILLDAMQGDIEDIDILNCWLVNNRPTLFGTTPGQLIYGSWNGGIFAKGDGRTLLSGVVKNLAVRGCRFKRNSGNSCWQHLFGLVRLHSNFSATDNFLEDCGLDGIEVGGMSGGVVAQNIFHRVGYVTTSDTDQPIPRWLPNAQATALDSSGLVKGVNYLSNSFISCNGGAIDTDSHGQSVIAGNLVKIPYPDEDEYVQDSIAISGISNSGSTSYGLQFNNSGQIPEGASDVDINANTFINLRNGAARLYATRRIFFTKNLIIAPSDSIFPPVGMGPVGSGPNQRCKDNTISGNKIDYSPGVAAPAIFEDDTFSAFDPSESNAVFANNPITPSGTLATEFQKSPTSGSVVFAPTVWFP